MYLLKKYQLLWQIKNFIIPWVLLVFFMSPHAQAAISLDIERLSDTQIKISASGTFDDPTPSLRSYRIALINPFDKFATGTVNITNNQLVTDLPAALNASEASQVFSVKSINQPVLLLELDGKSVAGNMISGSVELTLTNGANFAKAGSSGDVYYGSNNAAQLLTNTGKWSVKTTTAPPSSIGKTSLFLNNNQFTAGSLISLDVEIEPNDIAANQVDVYIGMISPSGAFLSLNLNGQFQPGVHALVNNWTPTRLSRTTLVSQTLAGNLPTGKYTTYMVMVPTQADATQQSNWLSLSLQDFTLNNKEGGGDTDPSNTGGDLIDPNAPPSNIIPLVKFADITLPVALEDSVSTETIWSWGGSLNPRLYHAPMADGRTLFGWTDLNYKGHVSIINNAGNALEKTFDFDYPVRGVVAHDDGTFTVLLHQSTAFNPKHSYQIYLSKRRADGSEMWTSNLTGCAVPRLEISDNHTVLGDIRLAYGNGRYGAYHTVYGKDCFGGHHGDQLTFIDDNGEKLGGGWRWGCSHSVGQVLAYNPSLDNFAAVCSSDAYPHVGLVINNAHHIFQASIAQNGQVSAQLGQIVPTETGWLLLFNAVNRPCCAAKGTGLAIIDADFKVKETVWLGKNSDGEQDAGMARIGGRNSNQFLVGWRDGDDHWLAVVDGTGKFIIQPEEVRQSLRAEGKNIEWGRRNEPFRTRPDGTVSWIQGGRKKTTIRFYHFKP